MATLLKAAGGISIVQPASGTRFTLAELQGFVGGYIEVLNAPGGKYLVVNEDGKRDTPTYNPAATLLMRQLLRPDDVIVGDAVLATWAELEGDGEGEQDDDA